MATRKRKAEDSEHSSKCKKKASSEKESVSSTDTNQCFFNGLEFFILTAGIQKTRLQLFKSQVEKFGGRIKDSLTDDTTHLIVDDGMTIERMCKILKICTPPLDKTIVKSAWLSACFRERKVTSTSAFELKIHPGVSTLKATVNHASEMTNLTKFETESKTVTVCDSAKEKTAVERSEAENELISSHTQHKYPKVGVMWNAFRSKPKNDGADDVDSDYIASDEDVADPKDFTVTSDTTPSTSSTNNTPTTSPAKNLAVEKWTCAQSSKTPRENINRHITSKLEEMVKNYESTNDKWRAFGYQKAIAALRRHPQEITSWEEARSLQGVGGKLADKIWEIAQSGELRKLNEFQSSEQIKVLKLFTDVWGAGPTTANAWYQQGFRTLEDLRTKANLTHQQKVGVRIYEDLLDRMPREEAAEIEAVVREAAESLQPGIVAQACGSYRRGKKDCGDVDVLITHPDGRSEKGLFGKLIQCLKDKGFLTDDLVSVEDDGNQKKYLGVCKLPGEGRKHRRLDIIVVPYEEYGCALVYFTGSAHFNRSLRHLCKKMNMSLNEHALKKGVVRKGQEKIFDGITVPTPTEESVFKTLGVPFRPPEERDH